VSLDDEAARRLRRAGFRVVRATGADLEAAEREAHDLGAACLVTADGPLLLRGGGGRDDAGRDDAGRGDGGDLDTRDLAARLRAALAGST
jgi:hypothetical protein